MQNKTINLSIGKIKLIHSEKRAPMRILCLHGWLDNHASFLPILPHLQDLECVAIDMVGHGESAHREINSLNHYIDYVRDIKLIMDALGWDQCHLLGHSMGGAIGLLAASALGDRIQSLAMIDILHPSSRKEEDGPKMLKKALNQFSNWDQTQQKVFPTLALAVRARLAASPFPQSKENARLIMQHATEKVATGYRLRSDARLAFRSPLMMSQAQLEMFIKAVEQPVLAILASDGLVHKFQHKDDTLALFQSIQTRNIKGGHHVHMENPREVSVAYLDFLKQFEHH